MTQQTHRSALEQALEALRSAKTTMWRNAPGGDYDRFDAAMTGIRAALAAGRAALAQTQGEALPIEGSEAADEAIQAMLKERQWPSSSMNAARAGWRAARLFARPQASEPIVSQGCATNSLVSQNQVKLTDKASEPAVQWCKQCGEGVTDFCRAKEGACAHGFQRPGQASEPAPLITVESSLRFRLESEQQKSADLLDEVRELKGRLEKVRGPERPAPDKGGSPTVAPASFRAGSG